MSPIDVPSFPLGSRHQPNYAWWRPVLEIITFLVITVALVFAVGYAMMWAGADPSTDQYGELFLYLTVAVEVPAALIAVKLAGRRPLETVFGTGPAPKLWTVLLAYLVALAVMFVVLGLISVYAYGSSWDRSVAGVTRSFPLTVVLVMCAALGEELAFRGLAFQAFSALTKRPLLGALIATLLFVAIHLPGSAAEFAHYFLDGVLYSWLAWYFGGIAFPFAVHAAWNTVVDMQDYAIPGSFGSMLTQFAASVTAVAVLAYVFRGAARPGALKG